MVGAAQLYDAKVLALLEQAAAAGAPAPTDDALGAAADISCSRAGRAIARLVTAGKIRVRRPSYHARVIEIVATGTATLPTKPRPPVSAYCDRRFARRGEGRDRNCLRCRRTFRSEWAGERVCPRCKSTKEYRSANSSFEAAL